jgi:hypothetical protein
MPTPLLVPVKRIISLLLGPMVQIGVCSTIAVVNEPVNGSPSTEGQEDLPDGTPAADDRADSLHPATLRIDSATLLVT